MNKTIYGISQAICALLSFYIIPSIVAVILQLEFGIKSQLILSTIGETVLLILLIIYYRKDLIKDFKSFDKSWFKFMIKWWLIGLVIMYASNVVINLIIFKGQIAPNEAADREMLQTIPILGLFLAGFIAPMTEELVFRKSFRNITDNKLLYIAVATFIFAFVHVTPGFIVSLQPLKLKWLQLIYLIPYGALALSFTIVYREKDNILTSMIMHMAHNTLFLLLLYVLLQFGVE